MATFNKEDCQAFVPFFDECVKKLYDMELFLNDNLAKGLDKLLKGLNYSQQILYSIKEWNADLGEDCADIVFENVGMMQNYSHGQLPSLFPEVIEYMAFKISSKADDMLHKCSWFLGEANGEMFEKISVCDKDMMMQDIKAELATHQVAQYDSSLEVEEYGQYFLYCSDIL
jgi:hypothetical protein